jgi:DNA-binding NtrC family response regulator
MEVIEGPEVPYRGGESLMGPRARPRPASSGALARLRGEHPRLRQAIDLALRAAVTDCSVLILGETGTGKELVARAIHEASSRGRGPMIAVNCGGIPRELIGSELFGHEKGAFTGATSQREGVFMQADRGTLFLDELGELPLDQQPHLLRVLETRMVRRVGGYQERSVDVRLVAATNRIDDVDKPDSNLRLDLFHRLATVIISLPPLRERPADIPLLVHAFMDEMKAELGEHTISRATMGELARYAWPGNVRELRQAVTRAMALCPDELTLDQLLPRRAHTRSSGAADRASKRARRRRRARSSPACYAPPLGAELRPIDIIIRDAFLDALDAHASLRGAAISLGIPKSTFSDWARRLGIKLKDQE